MFDVNINDLKSLAKNAQIEIKNEELSFFLESFEEVNKMLIEFSKFEIDNGVNVMNSIITNHLTIDDLENIKKHHVSFTLSKEIIEKNALISKQKFVLIK